MERRGMERVGDNAIRSLGGKKNLRTLALFFDRLLVLMMNARTDGCTLSSVLDGSMMALEARSCVHGAFFERKSWSAVHNCSRSALSDPFFLRYEALLVY